MTRQSGKLRARAALATAFALVALAASGQLASGHARLERSNPLSGSALDAMPGTITLEFSEAVVRDSVRLTLEHDDGTPLELRDAEMADNDRAVSALVATSSNLAGTFLLRWSVRSATDGHNSAGVIAFSAGTGRTPPSTSAGADRDPWWLVTVRAIWLLALTLIIAGVIAAVGVGPHPDPLWGPFGGALAFGSGIVTIRPWSNVDWSTGSVRWLVGAALLGLISGCLAMLRKRTAMSVAAVAWLATIYGLAAAGHAAGDARATAASVIHLSIALIWLGGLAALALHFDSDRLPEDLRRFSRLAIVGVPFLAITGIVLAAIGISDQRSLTDSTYGRTLLVKLATVVLVLAIAATNRWITRRWIEQRSPGGSADTQSRWILGAELAALATVVVLASALGATSPPGEAAIVQVASPLRTLHQEATVQGLSIRLDAQIAGQVDDRFTITVVDANGQSPAGVQRIIAETSFVDPATEETIPGEQFDADPIEGLPEAFEFSALRLSRQARWSIELTIRRNGLLDVIQPFAVDSREWRGEDPRVTDRDWRWPIVQIGARVLLAIAVLIPVAGLVLIRRNGQIPPVSGAILIVALAMIAAGFTVQAWQRSAERTAGHHLTAPPAPDLIAAQADYAALCLACHAADGAGLDAVDPLHHHGSGTDLTDRRSIALADGDLFALISAGVGDSDMPAYDVALTPQQRWNLVAYIRALQEKHEKSGSSN